ncbi:MAG: PAS domain S-box protein [Burkholderiales bacterium]
MNEARKSAGSFDIIDATLRTVAHAAHEAIILIDDEQRIVGLNPEAQRVFRCSQAAMQGRPLATLIPLASRHAHARHVEEFAASDAVERRMSKRAPIVGLRADGEEFTAEAVVSRLELAIPGGVGRFFVALLRDLSHERALQDELTMLKQRFRSILDLSPMAMWITEGDRIAFANRPALELFGVNEPGRLVGQSVYALLRPDSHASLREQHALALAGAAEVPMVRSGIVRPDGSVREVEIGSAPLPDHGETTMQMVLVDVTKQRAASLELERSRTELRRLSANAVEAREEERRHIARELHDELGQRLTALKMQIAGPQTPGAPGRVAEMLEMIDETVAAVRRIAADLRPLMLDDLGLNAAIEWLARDAARRIGIEVAVSLDIDDSPLDARASIAVYRMVQEALTNVARHARATDVRIQTRVAQGEFVLTIHDDGVGFSDDALQREGKYGLMGIRERAYMLGGRLEVDNPLGGGGRLTVRLPLKKVDAPAAEARP